MSRLCLASCPGLEERMVSAETTPALARLREESAVTELVPPLPAVTMPVQATLTTGLDPADHGIAWNGVRVPELGLVSPWEQSVDLVRGPRIWDRLREHAPDATVAVLFWQLALGAPVDVLCTPKPLHLPDGRTVSRCDSEPAGLYRDLVDELGPFPLHRYWGPGASPEASAWIAAATARVLTEVRPDLCLTYLPDLDYPLQKEGPGSEAEAAALGSLDEQIARIREAADGIGARLAVCGEYRIVGVEGPVHPNLALREAGLCRLRRAEGRTHLDTLRSPAFCVADHQVGHVFCRDDGARERAVAALSDLDHLEVLTGEARSERGLGGPGAGDPVCLAAPDRWLSYRWWSDPAEAPAFARTVDIHSKPGYDPLELFPGDEPRTIATDESLVRGSHGGPGEVGGRTAPPTLLWTPEGASPGPRAATRDVPARLAAWVADRALDGAETSTVP